MPVKQKKDNVKYVIMDRDRRKKLIAALNDCVVHCNHCADVCLDAKDIEAMVVCIRTDRVCAEVCATLAKVLSTSYNDVGDLIKYCHRLCLSCATECEKHEHKHCQDCAEACKKCASACKDMLMKYETSLIQQDENYL